MKDRKALWILFAAAILGLLAAGCMEGSDTILAGEEEVLGDALVAAWCFDEESGTAAVDSSASCWDGVLKGPSRTTGVRRGALLLDGEDDYVEVEGLLSGEGAQMADLAEGSISIWFRCDHIPEGESVAPLFHFGRAEPCADAEDDANEGIAVAVARGALDPESEELYFSVFDASCGGALLQVGTGSPVEEGLWNHVVIAVGASSHAVYLNGYEAKGRVYASGGWFSTFFFADVLTREALWIGKGFWEGEEVFFKGKIDDVRVYDRALTEEEVYAIYYGD